MKNTTKQSFEEVKALNSYATWSPFWKIELGVLLVTFVVGVALYMCEIEFGIRLFTYGVMFAIIYPILMVVMVNSVNKNHNAFIKKTTVNHYEITEDYFIENTEQDGEIISVTKLTYDRFVKCVDYKNYIFLFITKAQAYIIDKNGMTQGTVEGLMEFIERKGIKIIKAK